MKKEMNSIMTLLLVALLVFSISACGRSPSNEQANKSETDKRTSSQASQTADFKPFVIQNYNRQLAIEKVPQAVFAVSTPNTEILMALGLKDKIVGVAPGVSEVDILPQFQDAYNSLNRLEGKLIRGHNYPSFEAVVGTNPDFIYGTSFSVGNAGNITSLDNITKTGITTFISKPTDMLNAGMDDVYEEILTIGRIFAVETQAHELVQNMSEKIGRTQDKLGEIEKPIPVFVYDSEEEGMIFTAGPALITNIIELAGGKNIFFDTNKNWLFANKEKIVNSKPEIVIIIDYGETSAEDKIAAFKNNPLFAELPAVVNDQFVVVSFNDVLPGIRNADCIEELAKGFYPEKFK
ncbi:ABC transporter substrate-binding protein [Desulfosporosinus youngiae]|uniref:ABC-type Fe3+-hydroxamate transport system, periplasmic component n=1 Tax=Desulfosporosinus youngiae DSM 17734 TaxID=768710 RepID=H5Y633_9FIRM|nr:ABC transporter substrate-binding protein [Desulfosporosinus youngiae]EHQ91043.1 ABC-type Fe3+-hydroxamate transport system, periplasmic component [Desulfosporosinus youngiae DSM 17734]